MNNGNGTKRVYEMRRSDLATKAVVGSWWIKRRYMADSKGAEAAPRQIVSLSQSPLGPMVHWAPYGRWTKAPKAIALGRMLSTFDPCAAPDAPAKHMAPDVKQPNLRAIVREEVRAALADFAAELRPAIRAEALAAVNAAFGAPS